MVAPGWDEELDRASRQLAYDPLGELTRSLAQSAAKTLATDRRDGEELTMRRAPKTLPPDDLVRAIVTATELLAGRPPERTGELRALAESCAIVASAHQSTAAAVSEGRSPPGDMERLRARLAVLDARREQLEKSSTLASSGTTTARHSSAEPSSPARNSRPATPPASPRSSANQEPTSPPNPIGDRSPSRHLHPRVQQRAPHDLRDGQRRRHGTDAT